MYQIDQAGAMKFRRIEFGRRYCIFDLVRLILHQLSIPLESYIEDLPLLKTNLKPQLYARLVLVNNDFVE
jgi:hypothetical protein